MLIRLPASWPTTTVAAVAMLVLAILDLGGSLAAKEAVARRSPAFAALGCLLFVMLFWVYASSLQYAELGLVTLGWIVVLQVGVLAADRWWYGTRMPAGKWLAVGVILAAQAYLLLAPSGPVGPAAGEPAPVAAAQGTNR